MWTFGHCKSASGYMYIIIMTEKRKKKTKIENPVSRLRHYTEDVLCSAFRWLQSPVASVHSGPSNAHVTQIANQP